MRKEIYFMLIIFVFAISWLKLEDTLVWGAKTFVNTEGIKDKSKQNVYAHITVEGTAIDYPVAQHPTDDSYYLSHDFEGIETSYGGIFTEKLTSKNFKDLVTIIYGHSTYDGSMFGSLERFEASPFFESHQQIIVTTKDEKIIYEIFAAYSYTDAHLFQTFNLGNQTAVLDYFKQIQRFSESSAGKYRSVTFGENDSMLILSTCDTRNNERRFIVHAKETNRIPIEAVLKSK